jgi:transposase
MSRVAAKVTCNDEDRKELERLSASRKTSARLVERAKIVLGCLAGERNDQIAARMKLHVVTVATWRKRFVERGLRGLHNRARSGKPPVHVPDQLRARVLSQLEKPVPRGLSGWDGVSLAQALGVSDDAVWRILKKEGRFQAPSATGLRIPDQYA